MICRMCLMDSPDVLDIFAGRKTAFNIATTIAQHFWFEPKYGDELSNMVCDACWRKIESFHEYYLCVEEAQRKLSKELAVKPEQQEQRPRGHPLAAVTKQFLKLEPEEVNFANLGGDGIGVDVIEYTVEQKMEQDYTLDEANVYNYFIGEVALESTKSGGHHEDLIEEVKSCLYDDISEQTVTRHLEEQTNMEEFIKMETVDSCSKGHIVNVDYDSDDAPLASLRLRQAEIANTDQTKKRRKKSSDSLVKYKDDLKIARHIELKCDLCGGDFSTFAEIERHMTKTHRRRGYVKCCNRKLFEKGAILDHLHRHFDSDYFKCSKCNKSYSDKRCLKRHLSLHDVEEKGSKMYSCDSCSKRFHSQYLRNQHNCLISKDSCFSCEICSKSFMSETLLETHRKSVHQPKMCTICAKVIEGETLFAEHQLEHSDIVDQKLQCEKCGMWLKNPLRLKIHTKKVHRDGKSVKRREFACKICGRMSISNEGLKAHLRNVHAAQRKFVCSVCGKGFKRRRNLKDHMAGHTGELLYTCRYCPQTFKNSSYMYGHRKRAHHQELEENRRIRALPANRGSDAIQNITNKEMKINSNLS